MPVPTGGNGGKATGDTTIVTPTKDSIVYSDVNPDSVIGSYNLDINNDGIADFVFDKSTYEIQCVGFADFEYSYSDRYYLNLSVAPSNGNNEIITDGTYALALDSSSPIVPDSLWATVSQTLIEGATTTGHCIGALSSGHWLNVSDKYLGIKFIKNNNIYYGWARLSSSYRVSPAPTYNLTMGRLILKDYAYNSIPNQPIIAGQTH